MKINDGEKLVMKLSKVHCKECGGILNLDIVSHIKNQKLVCPYCQWLYIYEAKYSEIGAELEADIELIRLKEEKETLKNSGSSKN
ncbi:hypothetical protein MK801_11940 (plasmid) [Lactococcus lactis]|uniref:hypothetical protein n=1 Tax=Lactococcus lactis TaxID=1358 RepID=UPI0020B80F1B|nr:hypothetical protein MK801_11940 [Lactococcus lactis]